MGARRRCRLDIPRLARVVAPVLALVGSWWGGFSGRAPERFSAGMEAAGKPTVASSCWAPTHFARRACASPLLLDAPPHLL